MNTQNNFNETHSNTLQAQSTTVAPTAATMDKLALQVSAFLSVLDVISEHSASIIQEHGRQTPLSYFIC